MNTRERSVTHLAFDVLSFIFCPGNVQHNLSMRAERKKKIRNRGTRKLTAVIERWARLFPRTGERFDRTMVGCKCELVSTSKMINTMQWTMATIGCVETDRAEHGSRSKGEGGGGHQHHRCRVLRHAESNRRATKSQRGFRWA